MGGQVLGRKFKERAEVRSRTALDGEDLVGGEQGSEVPSPHLSSPPPGSCLNGEERVQRTGALGGCLPGSEEAASQPPPSPRGQGLQPLCPVLQLGFSAAESGVTGGYSAGRPQCWSLTGAGTPSRDGTPLPPWPRSAQPPFSEAQLLPTSL